MDVWVTKKCQIRRVLIELSAADAFMVLFLKGPPKEILWRQWGLTGPYSKRNKSFSNTKPFVVFMGLPTHAQPSTNKLYVNLAHTYDEEMLKILRRYLNFWMST